MDHVAAQGVPVSLYGSAMQPLISAKNGGHELDAAIV
jgi:hypothetical protein